MAKNGYQRLSKHITSDELTEIMKNELNRLRSFDLKWSYSGSLSGEKMAKAGFYHSSSTDKVSCPFCKINIEQWDKGDEPIKEHKTHSSTCVFIINPKKSGDIPIEGDPPVRKSRVIPRARRMGMDSFDPCRGASSLQPIDPGMEDATNRMMTFAKWPKTNPKQPYELCPAGFYWSGNVDQVRCFSCGGYIEKWCQVEDPWVEHARLHPHCEFVKSEKGQFFIDQVNNEPSVYELKGKLRHYARQRGFSDYEIDEVLNERYISAGEMRTAVLNMTEHNYQPLSRPPDDNY